MKAGKERWHNNFGGITDATFNYAQCLECMGEVEEALSVVQPLAERLLPAKAGDRAALSNPLPEAGDAARLADHAMVLCTSNCALLRVIQGLRLPNFAWKRASPSYGKKDKGVMPEISSWDRLLSVVDAWSKHVELAIRQKKCPLTGRMDYLYGSYSVFTAHHRAYPQILKAPNHGISKFSRMHQTRSLLRPHLYFDCSARIHRGFWIVGDSHCLSLAWTRLMVSKSGGRAPGVACKGSLVAG